MLVHARILWKVSACVGELGHDGIRDQPDDRSHYIRSSES